MSGAEEILKRVAISYPNLGDNQAMHHVSLESGRARRGQVYP